MNKIKYDSDSMKLITLFESMTGAKVRDCISNEKLIFVIEENEMGKAIGKKGINIKRIENSLKKKIKLIEFSNDISQFVKNMIYPIEALDIKFENGIVTIHGKDTSTKAMLIGREHQNINHLKDIVKRYFDAKEVKVV
ncbi:NusA-like transcription termination signal-binding factor [Candidatus Woesearchaeota archaeon]|nr:NusA-like transcription termination signal-binding factor [Candidatus Woesearchaeota archaeon]